MPHPPRCLWIGHGRGDEQRSQGMQEEEKEEQKELQRVLQGLTPARAALAVLECQKMQQRHYLHTGTLWGDEYMPLTNGIPIRHFGAAGHT